MRVILAGVAGVGKTTVARILAERLGLPYHRVEAEECWPLADPEDRQNCYAYWYQQRLAKGPGVYDNSMLTVYAYTAALLPLGPDCTSATIAELMLDDLPDVVVLAAARKTIEERIARRLEREPERHRNIVEDNIDIHLEAQRKLLAIAKKLRLPIIWVDEKQPETIANEILKLMKAEVAADV